MSNPFGLTDVLGRYPAVETAELERILCLELPNIGRSKAESLHPEEINDFLTELFADYAEDGDSATLDSALEIMAQAKEIRQQLMSRPFDSSPA